MSASTPIAADLQVMLAAADHCITTLRADLQALVKNNSLQVSVINSDYPFLTMHVEGPIIMGDGTKIDMHLPDAVDQMLDLIKKKFFSMAPYVASNIVHGYVNRKETDAGKKIPERTLRLLCNRATINGNTSFKFTQQLFPGQRPPTTFLGMNIRGMVENKVARDPMFAQRYAQFILRARWPPEPVGQLAELTIASHAQSALAYAKLTLRGRWNESTPVGARAQASILKTAETAMAYVADFLEPEASPSLREKAEEAIAQEPETAYRYAVNVLKHRWPDDTMSGVVANFKIEQHPRYSKSYLTAFKK